MQHRVYYVIETLFIYSTVDNYISVTTELRVICKKEKKYINILPNNANEQKYFHFISIVNSDYNFLLIFYHSIVVLQAPLLNRNKKNSLQYLQFFQITKLCHFIHPVNWCSYLVLICILTKSGSNMIYGFYKSISFFSNSVLLVSLSTLHSSLQWKGLIRTKKKFTLNFVN